MHISPFRHLGSLVVDVLSSTSPSGGHPTTHEPKQDKNINLPWVLQGKQKCSGGIPALEETTSLPHTHNMRNAKLWASWERLSNRRVLYTSNLRLVSLLCSRVVKATAVPLPRNTSLLVPTDLVRNWPLVCGRFQGMDPRALRLSSFGISPGVLR